MISLLDHLEHCDALEREVAARGRPAGRVGYSINLYELPPGEDRTGP